MRARHAVLAGVAGLSLLAAACGSSSGSDNAKAATPTSTTAAAAPATVAVKEVATFGKVLVGPNGHTLYLFEKDTGTTSACTGGCAGAWPALTAASPKAGDGVDASKLSTANGQAPNQVVYNGHLLYYFGGDSAAGDVKGAGIPSWYPVDASGDKVDKD